VGAGVPLVLVPLSLNGRATSEPLDGTSLKFGPYVGYNWQVAPQWLVGIEGDFGWGNQTTTLNGFAFSPGGIFLEGLIGDSFAIKTTWDATARGRVGYLVTPSFLAYLTGGAAWLHYETTSTCFDANLCAAATGLGPNIIATSTTRLGWTIGGGIETRLWNNWIARGEYRYADFGSASFTLTRTTPALDISTNHDIRVRTHTALFGIAYKFGDAGAVIARY
jgi:outer membrane immunogenic protein